MPFQDLGHGRLDTRTPCATSHSCFFHEMMAIVVRPYCNRVARIAELTDGRASIEIPSSPVYPVRDLGRGDAMANWSPDRNAPKRVASQRRCK